MATEEPIASRTPVSLDSRCPKGARSSAGERCLHTAEVTGSIPVAPTLRIRRLQGPSGPVDPRLTAHRVTSGSRSAAYDVQTVHIAATHARGAPRARPAR